MPVTPTVGRQCGSKRRYETREEAVADREQKIAAGTAREAIGAYYCKHCDGHHVGHRRQDAASRNGTRGKKRSRR